MEFLRDNYLYAKPFSDDEAKYIKTEHQYQLTLDYANHKSGLDLVELWLTEENAEWYLEYVRKIAYEYVLRNKDNKYYERMLWYLAHSKKAREAMLKIMIDTLVYNHEDGGFLIAYQTGLNLHEMKDIDIKIEHALSVVADETIKNYGLKTRILNLNMNTFRKYDTLEELLNYLLSETFITQEQKNEIEEIEDIPKSYKYRTFINPKGQFVFEDLLTFRKRMEKFGVDW